MTRRRNIGKRSIRPVMRIFTEGERTEINYVRGYISSYLKSKGYTAHDIIIEQPNDSSPLGLLNAARQTRLPMDEMWIVFDCDQHQHKPEAFKGAAEERIGVAYSSISFETWILLHFTYSTRSYRSCEELMKVLDRHYPNGYDKAMNNLFEETAGADHSRLPTAIANAKRLNREMLNVNVGKPTYELNPYTNVHELLAAIDAFIMKKHSRWKAESPSRH